MTLSEVSRLFSPTVVLHSPLGTSTWLMHLRWFAVVGQLMTVATVALLFPIDLPFGPLFTLIGFTAASNLLYTIWLGTWSTPEELAHESEDTLHRTQVASLLMTVDLFALSAMLYFSGGVDNPFAFFFFVNLAVGGVILKPRWAWCLTLLAVVCYAGLLLMSPHVAAISAGPPQSMFSIRQQGMLVAFSTCAAVVTYFVSRIAEELTLKQALLREAQQQRSRSQRLEALTTLAAGAAHELASPLSTIAVVVRELERQAQAANVPDSIQRDLVLIDSELSHCKAILSRMRNAAGDQAAEQWNQITLVDLIDAVVDGIRDPHLVDVSDDVDQHDEYVMWLPMEAVAQAIRNLVGNALDASPPETAVQIEVHVEENAFAIDVIDSGDGMPAEVQQRAVEPFYTTKEPGDGMGLGLFLARNVITRLGGKLEFESNVGDGTRARVSLPRQQKNVGARTVSETHARSELTIPI